MQKYTRNYFLYNLFFREDGKIRTVTIFLNSALNYNVNLDFRSLDSIHLNKMANYNLEVLNDKEFEELCKDILENELGILFQIFKWGRDKGIDLRYAQSNENQIIVQAKHMMKSKYSVLKMVLKKEKSSIEKLPVKAQRYILMTTLNLSVGQTDEIEF